MFTNDASKEGIPVDRSFALRSIARETYSDGTPKYHGLVVDGVIVVIDMAPYRFEPNQAPGVPLIHLVA